MSAGELEDWLQTDESKKVGQKDGVESKGPRVGPEDHRDPRQKNKSDHTDDDIDHMRRVVSYVHRHQAQKPQKEDVETSNWCYSLMNWGNDPLK